MHACIDSAFVVYITHNMLHARIKKTDYDFGGDNGGDDDDDEAWEHFQEPLPEGALGNIDVPKPESKGTYIHADIVHIPAYVP